MVKEKEDKQCTICHNRIDDKGEYCRMTQYDKQGKLYKNFFYHINCWYNRWKGNMDTAKLLEKTNYIADKLMGTIAN